MGGVAGTGSMGCRNGMGVLQAKGVWAVGMGWGCCRHREYGM